MLQKLSPEIRECYRHAELCKRLGEAALTERGKAGYLDMERRWLFGPQLRICRAAIEFHRFVQDAQAAQVIRPEGMICALASFFKHDDGAAAAWAAAGLCFLLGSNWAFAPPSRPGARAKSRPAERHPAGRGRLRSSLSFW
jgi:hypothetical protein